MIRVIGEARITWDERDVMAMTEILGADHSVQQWCPFVPSVLRDAHARGITLSRSARQALHLAWRNVRTARALQACEDAAPVNALMNRAWPHQRADVDVMLGMKQSAYLLAHQPGVGKTLESIAWALLIARATRILIICPNSAKYQWRRELKRWTALADARRMPITVVDGTIAQQNERASMRHGWVVTHWQSLAHAHAGLTRHGWDAIIADEAHNAQNRDTRRAQTLFTLRAPHRIALTAHPFTNRPDELWSILHFLHPERYSSYWRFFHQHALAVPMHFGGFQVLGTRDSRLLKWELAPFTLRRTNASLGRRDVTRIPRTVTLTPKARAEYKRLRKRLFVELEAVDPTVLLVPNDLARVTRLRQYLVDPALIRSSTPSVKYPVVAELIGELDAPPVIFTAFRQAAERLQTYLYGQGIRRVKLITGRVKSRVREVNKRAFLNGRLDALIVQTGAGGESLNLGKYGYVIHLDLPWNPRGLEQSEGRVNRPEEGTGKIAPTTVYHITVEDSYEQRQGERLERKHRTFSEVFTAGTLRHLFEDHSA